MSFSINEDGLTISIYDDEDLKYGKHRNAPLWFDHIFWYVADRGFNKGLNLYEDKISDNVYVLKRGKYEIARYLKVDGKIAPIRFLRWKPDHYMTPYSVEMMHIDKDDMLNFSSLSYSKRARIVAQYRKGIKKFRETLNGTLLTLITSDYIDSIMNVRLLHGVDLDERILSHFRKSYYKTKKIIAVPTSESDCYTVIKKETHE